MSVELLALDPGRSGNFGGPSASLEALDGGREGVRGGGMGLFPLLGGKGGNSASPQAGARILLFPESAEVDDVPIVLPVLVEAVEIDASDATDSREFL